MPHEQCGDVCDRAEVVCEVQEHGNYIKSEEVVFDADEIRAACAVDDKSFVEYECAEQGRYEEQDRAVVLLVHVVKAECESYRGQVCVCDKSDADPEILLCCAEEVFGELVDTEQVQ